MSRLAGTVTLAKTLTTPATEDQLQRVALAGRNVEVIIVDRQAILVVGGQRIVPDLDAALRRVREPIGV